MADVDVSRKQRLRTLENIIRSGYEGFVQTGFALMEIRDERLYEEDGFETWDRYLKDRVGEEFGIEETHVRRLIVCAQVRPKLPDPINHARLNAEESDRAWTVREVYELARLAPKKKEPGQPFDIEKLDRRDVNRVVNKVSEHCRREGVKPTSTVVRKIVDEELGIDRTARGKETRQRREEEAEPELHRFLIDLTGRIEAERDKLATVNADGWKQLRKHWPNVVKRLTAACDSLADLIRRAGE
jgi:hypothetical protein